MSRSTWAARLFPAATRASTWLFCRLGRGQSIGRTGRGFVGCFELFGCFFRGFLFGLPFPELFGQKFVRSSEPFRPFPNGGELACLP
jgi:hypothetical protein